MALQQLMQSVKRALPCKAPGGCCFHPVQTGREGCGPQCSPKRRAVKMLPILNTQIYQYKGAPYWMNLDFVVSCIRMVWPNWSVNRLTDEFEAITQDLPPGASECCLCTIWSWENILLQSCLESAPSGGRPPPEAPSALPQYRYVTCCLHSL